MKHSVDTDECLVHTYFEVPSAEGSSKNQICETNGLLSKQVLSHETWKETASKLVANSLPQCTNIVWIGHKEELIRFLDLANVTHIQKHITAEVLMPELPVDAFSHSGKDGTRKYYIWQRQVAVQADLRNKRRHLGVELQKHSSKCSLEIKYKCDNSAIARQFQEDKDLELVVKFLFRKYTHAFLTPLGTTSECMIFRVHSVKWSEQTRISHESETLLKVGPRGSIKHQHDSFVHMHKSTRSMSILESVVEDTFGASQLSSCHLAGIRLFMNGTGKMTIQSSDVVLLQARLLFPE